MTVTRGVRCSELKNVSETIDCHSMKWLALVMLGLLSVAPSGYGAESNAASGLPLDVAAFKERRDLCDHFRGEEPI
jgi:hypothetical protein